METTPYTYHALADVMGALILNSQCWIVIYTRLARSLALQKKKDLRRTESSHSMGKYKLQDRNHIKNE